jgi:hypothetical protein
MTYAEQVKVFEKRIAPFVSGASDGIEYAGFICSVYHFLSEATRREWDWIGRKKVVVLGSWGPKSLVIGRGWDRGKWHSPDPISRVKEWSRLYCPGMMEEKEWTLDGLRMKSRGG